MHHVVSMSSFMFCFQNLILQRNVKKMLITTVKLEETLSGLQRRKETALPPENKNKQEVES